MTDFNWWNTLSNPLVYVPLDLYNYAEQGYSNDTNGDLTTQSSSSSISTKSLTGSGSNFSLINMGDNTSAFLIVAAIAAGYFLLKK